MTYLSREEGCRGRTSRRHSHSPLPPHNHPGGQKPKGRVHEHFVRTAGAERSHMSFQLAEQRLHQLTLLALRIVEQSP